MGTNKKVKNTYFTPPNYQVGYVRKNTLSIPHIGDDFYYTNVYHVYIAYRVEFIRRGISAY
jgi:hypothetical protein